MSDSFRAGLQAARAKRGYLLPHHGLFRLLSPDFAEAYEAAYGRLALQPVALPAEEKEFLWLVITAVVGSATARHHVRRYREAGGGIEGVEAAALEALTPTLPPSRRALALLAACTARRDSAGVQRYLRAAYAAGVAETWMAEAMCLTVQPAGLPNVVHAAGLWRGVIASGEVQASDAFRAWVEIPAEGDA